MTSLMITQALRPSPGVSAVPVTSRMASFTALWTADFLGWLIEPSGTPAKVVDVFVEYYGPTNRAYSSLNDDGRKALHDDLTALWTRNNMATDGTTRVLAEYIEAIGTRA